MDSLEEMGKKAYQKQMWGAYEDALVLYTDAIKRFPNDPRLFNNRCMCYIELKDYKRALEDAESMTLVFSRNKKAHFRKGEALVYLQRYLDAEEAFKKVLKLDPNCEETYRQLMEVQALELSRQGKYPKKKIMQALRMSDSVVEAERLLRSGKLDAINRELEDAVYYSDEDNSNLSDQSESDPLMDPNNPLMCCTLWIGNLTKDVTEQTLKSMFGKYGRIKSLKSTGQYAFVNYFDAVGPGKAMKSLQGAPIAGKHLIIKYPDNACSLPKKVIKSK